MREETTNVEGALELNIATKVNLTVTDEVADGPGPNCFSWHAELISGTTRENGQIRLEKGARHGARALEQVQF